MYIYELETDPAAGHAHIHIELYKTRDNDGGYEGTFLRPRAYNIYLYYCTIYVRPYTYIYVNTSTRTLTRCARPDRGRKKNRRASLDGRRKLYYAKDVSGKERHFIIFFLFPTNHYHSDTILTLLAVVVVRWIKIKNKFNRMKTLVNFGTGDYILTSVDNMML